MWYKFECRLCFLWLNNFYQYKILQFPIKYNEIEKMEFIKNENGKRKI